MRRTASIGARVFLALAVTWVISAAAPGSWVANAAGDRLHWEPVEQGHVKLEDKTPIKWNLFQPTKKSSKNAANLILVLLGRRYLMLDIKAKLAYAVVPGDLQAQGHDLESDDLAQESRLIPSTEWTVRDVGPEELIRLRLGDYDRTLQVELAHPNLSIVR